MPFDPWQTYVDSKIRRREFPIAKVLRWTLEIVSQAELAIVFGANLHHLKRLLVRDLICAELPKVQQQFELTARWNLNMPREKQ